MVCTVVHSHTLPATNKHRYYLFSEQMNKCFFHVCSRSHSTIIFFLHHQYLASSSFSSSSCAMIYDSTNMTMAMLCLFVACMCAVRVSFRIANSQRKKHQTQLNKKKKKHEQKRRRMKRSWLHHSTYENMKMKKTHQHHSRYSHTKMYSLCNPFNENNE